MNLYIHIGLPKTGTSAIQAHLFLNEQWFLDRGVLIPGTGHVHGFGHVTLFKGPSYELVDELNDELKKHEAQGIQNAFVSWEGLPLVGAQKLQEIREKLSSHSIYVVAYLREQSEVLQSVYLQTLKTRAQKRSIEDYLRSKKLLTPRHLNYLAILEKFDSVFGSTSIIARVYKTEHFKACSVLHDILSLMGLEADKEFVMSKEKQNISLDVPSAYLLNLLDGYYTEEKGRKNLVDTLLDEIAIKGGQGKYFLNKEQVEYIQETFKAANVQLQKKYFPEANNKTSLFSPAKKTWCSLDERAVLDCYRDTMNVLYKQREYIAWDGELLEGMQVQYLVSTTEGWSNPESWGIWSEGKRSWIKFRLPRSNISPRHTFLKLTIQGKYFHDNTETKIIVNNRKFIESSLTNASFNIPINELDNQRRISIELVHLKPVSPMALGMNTDHRELAFGIKNISYILCA